MPSTKEETSVSATQIGDSTQEKFAKEKKT